MQNDKITDDIHKKLKKIEKDANTYAERQEQLRVCLKKIYGDMSSYSVEDIIRRKAYLESKLDSENSILANEGMAIFTWLALEGGKQCLLAASTKSFDWSQFFFTMLTPFLALIPCKPIAVYLGKVDTKYRKYNLIDFELKIINRILEKEYNYDGIVDDILISRCRSSRDETEI